MHFWFCTLLLHEKVKHHVAFQMLGDMAVSHPQSRFGELEQDVDRLARPHENRVLPDEVGRRLTVSRENEKSAGTVHVERMVHRMVALHRVDEADLHAVAKQ